MIDERPVTHSMLGPSASQEDIDGHNAWVEDMEGKRQEGSLSDRERAQLWHRTEGAPDWREKVSMLANTDVPGEAPSDQFDSMNETEDQVYRAMLHGTRKRQNGEYPMSRV